MPAVNWKTSVTGAAGGAATGAAAGPWGALIGAGIGAGGALLGGSSPRGAAHAGASQYMQSTTGIPLPGLSGSMLGAQNKRQQEAQYPGTNPWERLGAPQAAAGAIAQTKAHGKIQKELQSKDLSTKLQVANIAAGAHVEAARTTSAPAAARAPSQIRETDMRTAHQKIINKYLPEHERARITVAKWAQTGPALWNIMDAAEKGQFDEPGIKSTSVKVLGATALTAVGGVAYRRFMALGKAAAVVVRKTGFGKAAATTTKKYTGKLSDAKRYSKPNPKNAANIRPEIGAGSNAWKMMQQAQKKRKR